MSSELLVHSAHALDDATENLTFDEFAWAFEDAWLGAAWALSALLGRTLVRETVFNDARPRPGALAQLLAQVGAPLPHGEAVTALEALAGKAQGALMAEEVTHAVFAAWSLHDACGLRLGVADDRLGEGLLVEDPAPGRVGSKVVDRRDALRFMVAGGFLSIQACSKPSPDKTPMAKEGAPASAAPPAVVAEVKPLTGQIWPTQDPFLFCAYHQDDYPVGNGKMGPAASLAGRTLGRDFAGRDNWRMYHGREVPGFPRHPHRGFETVTVVRQGRLDHADSMGATARYGGGDVQWLTAGRGIQHAEMFPLLRDDAPNPLELFQIWLNLPSQDKMVDPHFKMLWSETIPRVAQPDDEGRLTQLTLAAGAYGAHKPPAPPPSSWASRPEAQVAIWSLRMEPGARFTLPAVSSGTERALYVHRGAVAMGGRTVGGLHMARVTAPGQLALVAGGEESEVLLLQGRPIGEPVAKRGPFVMNTQDEIRQAYADYRRTQFGGWPWPAPGPVHPKSKDRFARYIGGKFEEPG